MWLWWMIWMLWSTSGRLFDICSRFWLFWKQRRQLQIIWFIAILIETESEIDLEIETEVDMRLWWMIWMLWSTHSKEFDICLRFWLFWKQPRRMQIIWFIAILIETESEIDLEIETEVEMWL
jgi:hypothetical protein